MPKRPSLSRSIRRLLKETQASKTLRLLVTLSAISLFGGLTSGCETAPVDEEPSCTAIGCGTPYGVDFVATNGWSAGEYKITVDLDGTSIVCKATLPFNGCDGQDACNDPSTVLLGRSGCALDASQHQLTGLTLLNVQPEKMTVTVQRSDEVLGEGTWLPSFSTSRPNGPNCEPVCTQAPSEKLSLK